MIRIKNFFLDRSSSIRNIFYVIIALGFFGLLSYFPDYRSKQREKSRKAKIEQLDNNIQGRIIEIRPLTHLGEGKSGTHFTTYGFYIKYEYWVAGKRYIRNNYFENNKNNKLIISRAYTVGTNNRVTIKYENANPENSLIDL